MLALLKAVPTKIHPAKKELAVVRELAGNKSVMRLYADGAQKASKTPRSIRQKHIAPNVLAKNMPMDVVDQQMAAQPSKILRVKTSAKRPEKRTKNPKIKLKRGPATRPYLAGVKFGIAY